MQKDTITSATALRWLKVPFSEKEDAKKAGAKWDPLTKLWYANANIPIQKVSRWLIQDSKTHQKSIG